MGCIYLMKSQDAYKIGITDNVRQRFDTFKTGNPNIEFVTAYEVGDKSMHVESLLHGRFRNRVVYGEWFRLDDSDILAFHQLCKMFGSETKWKPKEKTLQTQKKDSSDFVPVGNVWRETFKNQSGNKYVRERQWGWQNGKRVKRLIRYLGKAK